MSRRPLLHATAFVLLLATSAGADRPSVAITARSIGMGGLATGLADDVSATFWNPSGLALLQRQEIAFSYADRFGLGLKNSYTSYSLPLFERHAIGIDWLRESFGDDELTDALNVINLGYAFQLHRTLSLGVGAKLAFQSIDLNGVSLRSASGAGLDLGLVYTPKKAPFDRFKVGLALQDVGGTSLRDDASQLDEEIFEQTLRGGLSVAATRDLTLGIDVDEALTFGAEYQPLGGFLVRAGVNRELDPPQGVAGDPGYAFGFGLRWNSLRFDYAFEHHPVLPATHHATLSLSYNASLVTIKDAIVRPSPIFKSLYRTYEQSDFVDVVLRNASADALDVTVSIDVPTLTAEPHEETISLPPQSTERYGFTLTFPQDLLSSQPSYYDNLVQPTVRVSYASGRGRKTATRTLSSVYVLGKGKLSWSNPQRIAAFITPESRTVDAFARGLVGGRADLLRDRFGGTNIGKAALVFDALGAHGLRYQQDQSTPYVEIFNNESVFDTVKYPYEFLDTKIGDCDDCTAVYCAMLENLNIPTAVLDVNDPEFGHIYTMFDSGVPVERAGDWFLNEQEYVLWQDRLWIPVETTLFGSSFADAWRNGAEEYYLRKARGYINEILVSEAQQTFRPGVVPDVDVGLPPADRLDDLFGRDLAYFENRLDRIASAAGVSLDSAEGLYDAGATYLRMGQLDRALDAFDHAIGMDSSMADAYNAKGVVLTRKRRYDEAAPLYNKALALNPSDAGYRINVALNYHLQGRADEAQRAYSEAVQLNDSFRGVLDFLTREVRQAETLAPSQDPLGRMAAQRAYDEAAAFIRLERYDRAEEALKRALTLNASNADANNGMGVIETRRRNYQKAVDHFRRAIFLEGGDAGYHLNLAIVYHLMGRRADALAAYRKALEIDPAYDGLLPFLAP